MVLDGAAMFLVEGGHVWRNKRASVFFRPSSDRVWEANIDPTGDYMVFSLTEVRETVGRTQDEPRRKKRKRSAQG